MAESSKELLRELKKLKGRYGKEALNTAYKYLEPVILDVKDLEGCLKGSYENRWKYMSNLAEATKNKKVKVTEEFKSKLYEVMIGSEAHELCPMITCYLNLAQELSIEYASEELTRILFERPHRLAATPYLVLKNIIKMGAEIDPEKLAEWAGFSLAESVVKENLLGDKTKIFKQHFIKLKSPDLEKEIKDTKKEIQEYRKNSWLQRFYDKHIRLEDKLKYINTSLGISKECKSELLKLQTPLNNYA